MLSWWSTVRSYVPLLAVALAAAVLTVAFPDVAGGAGVALAMAGVIDATAWSEKMLRKISQSATDWENGIKNPSTSPVAAMKKAKGRFKNEMTAALNEDRWGKAIDKLTDDQIVAGALAAGGGRFVQGVTTRSAKVTAAIAALQPKVAALKARLDALPVDTDQQREAKMIEAKRGMEAIGRELSGLGR